MKSNRRVHIQRELRAGQRGIPLAAAAVFAILLVAGPAHSAFPGENGKIAFARDADIWVMDSDGNNPTNLTESAALEFSPVFSADGSKIAYESDFGPGGDDNIYVMNADGSLPVALTSDGGEDREPAFSPDGTKIAFQSDRDGGFEIYDMDAVGSNQVRLTNLTGERRRPAYSPDGTTIAFDGNHDTGASEIYVMDAGGSTPERLTFSTDVHPPFGGNTSPAFSPDGGTIAFESNDAADPDAEIYTMNTAGGEMLQLTNNGSTVEDGAPAFSPDGQHIAFYSSRINPGTYVMNLDGSNQTRLGVADSGPDWQPLTGSVDLAISLSDSPDPAVEGDQLTYTLTATNEGPMPATGVALADTLPETVTFISATPGCSQSAGAVTCTVGSLAAGASTSRQIVTRTSRSGVIVDTASISGAQPDPVSANDSAVSETTVKASTDAGNCKRAKAKLKKAKSKLKKLKKKDASRAAIKKAKKKVKKAKGAAGRACE